MSIAGTSGDCQDFSDPVRRNLERAVQSRRQYFAAPVVSGVSYDAGVSIPIRHAATTPFASFEEDSFDMRDHSQSSELTPTPACTPHSTSPPTRRGYTGSVSSPRAASVYSDYQLTNREYARQFVEHQSSDIRGATGSYAMDSTTHTEHRDASGVGQHYQQQLSPIFSPVGFRQHPEQQEQNAVAETTRRERAVALQRVEVLTDALDDARHQLLARDKQIQELRAAHVAYQDTVEQLQYECQRLQICARRDHVYQTQCGLALLATQEEYARRALTVAEEKWRLSLAFSERWEANQQRQGEALDRWAQLAVCVPVHDSPPAAHAPEFPRADTSLVPGCTSPPGVGRHGRVEGELLMPAFGRPASVPVSPRSHAGHSESNGTRRTSQRCASARTEGSLSNVKTGLLAEITAAKKALESELALAQKALEREQTRCCTRDEEIARLKAELAQERQLTQDLQEEVEDMVQTEMLLREASERCRLEADQSASLVPLLAESSRAVALTSCAHYDSPWRDTSAPSAPSLCSTPVRQTSTHVAEQVENTKCTPPNRGALLCSVSPLPSPSPLPAIRLREAQLEHYRRHMDPFDDSGAASTEASLTSAAAAGSTRTASSPVHAAHSYSLSEVRCMMDQLLKTYLMPLKISVESIRATSTEAREQQQAQLQALATTAARLEVLTRHGSGGSGSNNEMVEAIGSIVTDCHTSLMQKVDSLQQGQENVLHQVQETARLSKKAARILSHNDVVMDGKLKDIVSCQSTLSRQQLSSILTEQSPSAHDRLCQSQSPARLRSSSQDISPDGPYVGNCSGSSASTRTPVDAPETITSGDFHRGSKQVSFQMPLFDKSLREGRKTSVLEMSRSAVGSISQLMTEGEELFKPHSVAFASPPSHIWDLVDSDDESVPPLPTGAGFRTPYDVDSGS